MPIYSFKCRDCNTLCDINCAIDERDVPRVCPCPDCQGELKRQLEFNINFVDNTSDYHKRKSNIDKEISRIKRDAKEARELDIIAAKDFV